jgi:DNA-binding response OmpR family regulator
VGIVIFNERKKMRILIVEDEEDVANTLKVRLKTSCYNAIIATDSIQGVTMAHKD